MKTAEYFEIAWAEQALKDYEQCLKKKWGWRTIEVKRLEAGLCWYFYKKIKDGNMFADLWDECGSASYICCRGDYYHRSHEERFAPRIKFLKAFIKYLKKYS